MATMGKGRLEAFSDGVIAIIITIMVLEIKVPHEPTLEALRPSLPIVLGYLLSFIYVGIYWNNHHHMLHLMRGVTGSIMWANLHLLFWLSLVPFATAWVGECPEKWPTALYGFLLLMCGAAFNLLRHAIVRHEGKDSALAQATGRDWKGTASLVLYILAIGLAFVQRELSLAIYIVVALMWIVPDRRIERGAPQPEGT